MFRKRERQAAGDPVAGISLGASSAGAMMEVLESASLWGGGGGVETIDLGEAVLARLELRLPTGGLVRVQGWLRPPDFDDVSALPFRGARAAWFVMEVAPSRLKGSHAALADFAARSKAVGRPLLQQPFLLQYHGIGLHPGFDPEACDRWLGLPGSGILRHLSRGGVEAAAGEGLGQLGTFVEPVPGDPEVAFAG